MSALPPGSTIGILGSGQLGRMLGVAAAQLGYRVHVYAPESGPANDVASAFTRASYHETEALIAFARACDVVTYEFENVPVGPLAAIAERAALHPAPRALEIAQSRIDEKQFVRTLGGATAPFAMIDNEADLAAALAETGVPAILKTNRLGYDGKGQARIAAAEDAAEGWEKIGGEPAIAEGFVTFASEFSVLLVRGRDGETACYPPVANVHRDGILHTSTVPAKIAPAMAGAAQELAGRIAKALDYVGVLACEFFATADGPVFNEMAPRVHNSGHWTIEGAETSQFENHVRAICGLPLGSTALAGKRAVMENLIGDDADRWAELFAETGAHVHLYGKREARPGRKMGHVTRVKR